MKALFCAVVLLLIAQCTLGQVAYYSYLGTISVVFDDEDPHSGQGVDDIITIGSSLGATITLDPVPDFPQRFEIISTIPDIIHVSHSTVIFSRGQASAHIVLESSPDGKIGKSSILVTPEKNGYYQPIEFDIFVQGIISVDFFDDDDCVGVGRLERIVVSFQPPVPGNVELSLNATSGVFVNETVIVETGKETETLYFNGTDISHTTIYVNVTGLLYPSLTLDFDVFGTIISSPETFYMIQGAPKYFNISVLPEIDPTNPPFISTSASNAVVTPNAFILDTDGVTEVEVIPVYYGISRVTYSSANYCPHSDIFSVAVAPICSEGYVPNIIGDTCVICPGNFVNSNVYFADSTCNEHGDCGYSKCFTNKAVCFCNYPYVGFACQWDSLEDTSRFDSSELNNDPFVLHVENFPQTTGPASFYAPGDLVADNLQPGLAIVAGYDPSSPFFGAVNPESNPPTGTTYSGISWYWENTCEDNTIITSDFTSPVNVTIPMVPEVFTNTDLLQAEIWRHDETSGKWVKSVGICSRTGYNSTYMTTDLLSYTVSGAFCAPGQYAIFVVPVTPVPANTGNTIVRNPSFDELSTTASGTGRTGWQAAPPVKPPVNPQNFDPSPGKVLHLTSVDDAVTIASGSITVASIAVLSACLLLLF